MCTQTKTIEEKRSNGTKKYIITTLFHPQKVLPIKHLVGKGQPFLPNHLGRVRKNMFWLREGHSLFFLSAQKSSSHPHYK